MSVLTVPLPSNSTRYTEISQNVIVSLSSSIIIPERYLDLAISRRNAKVLEDGRWFAEIPNFTGLYGEGETENAATDDLAATLVGWLALKIQDSDGNIPVLENIDLNS